MLIAIIDDGIDWVNHPELKVIQDLVVEHDGNICLRKPNDYIFTAHGTTCAQIIHLYAKKAEFCSIKIFHQKTLYTNICQMISALRWCERNSVPLIHMSIGTLRLSDYEPLRKTIYKIIKKGQVIVSAYSNYNGRYTLPACLSGVFGVMTDESLNNNEIIINQNCITDGVSLIASSKHWIKNKNNSLEITDVVNSFAAPTVTAKIHNVLCERNVRNPPIGVIWSLLTGKKLPCSSLRPDFLTEAIVYDPGQKLNQSIDVNFQIISSFIAKDSFISAIKNNLNIPALICPPFPEEDDPFWDDLLEWSKWRIGIVCAGAASLWVSAAADCLFWDETIPKKLIDKMYTRCLKVDTPIVCIKPYNEHSFTILKRLKEFFLRNEFECQAISDYPMCYLYSIEFIPLGCDIKKLVNHFCVATQPDIILSMVSNPILENLEDAVIVTISDETEMKVGMSCSEKTFFLPHIPSECDFQHLLCYLSGE